MASAATTPDGSEEGGHIALGKRLFRSPRSPLLTGIPGGIIFQFIATVVYMFLTTEFLVRFTLKKPFSRREDTLSEDAQVPVLDSKTKQMIFGVGLSSVAMFVR